MLIDLRRYLLPLIKPPYICYAHESVVLRGLDAVRLGGRRGLFREPGKQKPITTLLRRCLVLQQQEL